MDNDFVTKDTRFSRYGFDISFEVCQLPPPKGGGL